MTNTRLLITRFITRLITNVIILSFTIPVFAAEKNSSPPNQKQQEAAATQQPNNEPEEKQQLKFNIWEFQVSGNTVLDHTLVERSVYPFLGRNKTADDVDEARIALQTLFKDNGFPTVLVDIPQQDVSKGIVKLNIIEGKVDRLKVSGSRYFSLSKISETIPALAVNEVPHLPSVQKQLQLLNMSNSDLRVTPIFRPGKTTGTVSVDLRVKDELPLHGSLELNGRNSAGTSRTRLVTNLSYDNLWLKSHNISLMHQTSPEKSEEVNVLVGTYVLPVSNDNDRLAIYAIRSKSNTGVASGGDISVIGEGSIIGARWVKPLFAEQSFFHSLVLGADHKDFDEGVQLVGADTLETPINYTILSLEYSATSFADTGKTSISTGFHFAPRALGNSAQEFAVKRFKAQPNFSYLSVELSKAHRFDDGVKLFTTIGGQLAGQPLISNEQYSVGGAETVRGYFESQLLGDDGVRASIELQSPDYESMGKYGFSEFHVKAFLDGAVTRTHNSLPDIDDQEEIVSAGFGINIATKKSFNLSLDIASPLKQSKTVKKEDVRVHFLIRGTF